MKNNQNIRFCNHCVYADGLGLINPATGMSVTLKSLSNKLLCEQCYELEMTNVKFNASYFYKELNNYLNHQNRILFAYSGGLDSTAVLFFLKQECLKRNIKLTTFTIDHGYKGQLSLDNVKNVIKFLNVDHFWVDIVNQSVDDSGLTVLEKYHQCFKSHILPCGPICNSIIDKQYAKIMNSLNFSEMFTGGDTPKKNSKGIYSIFWAKKSGINIVRGGCAFGLNKNLNDLIIKTNNIPWIRPNCGGYDTDCLLPGAFFRQAVANRSMSLLTVANTFPIIFDYLAERVRFNIIERNEAIAMVNKIDIGDQQCFAEIEEIFETINLLNS